jgi:two-component sensor histidine kinase
MEWTENLRPNAPLTPVQVSNDPLPSENTRLRARLVQAGLDAERLLADAGIKEIESDAARRLQQLLLEELLHRMKNLLANVMSIISQSLRNASSLEDGRLAVEKRLIGLSRAQDLLLRTNWSNSRLTDVIRGAVEPFEVADEDKFQIDDCSLEIGAHTVMPLTLSLNELCTNAVKYGALSKASGRIAIALEVDEAAQRLLLIWTETGGPLVCEPARRSFGTRLVKVLAHQIDGNATLSYDPGGFKYELDVPLCSLQAHAG